MRKFIKKGILLLAVLLFTGLTGTYAYFSDSVKVTNHIKTGDVNIGIREYQKLGQKEILYSNPKIILPGDKISKIPRITNYAMPCWIRVKLDYTESVNEQTGLTDKNVVGLDSQWVKRGEYYYYKKVLKKSESVDVFHALSIPAEWGNAYEGQSLKMTVKAEAIQAANIEPDFTAMSPWGNQIIELCVHEENGQMTCRKKDMELSVIFNGQAHRLIAAPDDFFQNFGFLMPGDHISDSIEISNTTDKEAEIFFHVEGDNLDNEQKKILNEMELKITVNGKLFYSGNVRSAGLTEPLSLGKYKPNEKGTMDFSIAVPKEWNNVYANKAADIDWIFTVKEDSGESNTPEKDLSVHQPENEIAGSVKTGDKTPINVFVVLLGVSVCLLLWFLFHKKRRPSL